MGCSHACCPATDDAPSFLSSFFLRSFLYSGSIQVKFFLKLASLALLSTALFAGAPAVAQKLLPEQSELLFVSRQMGVPVEGRFEKFEANVAFDPEKLATSKITFRVDTGSATLGVRETDVELPKPVWFDTGKFPQAIFESSSIKAAGGGKFEVTGKLTIKGTAQVIVVPVAVAQAGLNTAVTGAFAIKRRAFRIGENEWADTSILADEVQVRFKLTLAGVAKI